MPELIANHQRDSWYAGITGNKFSWAQFVQEQMYRDCLWRGSVEGGGVFEQYTLN
jgi:hypothetical protein